MPATPPPGLGDRATGMASAPGGWEAGGEELRSFHGPRRPAPWPRGRNAPRHFTTHPQTVRV